MWSYFGGKKFIKPKQKEIIFSEAVPVISFKKPGLKITNTLGKSWSESVSGGSTGDESPLFLSIYHRQGMKRSQESIQ